MGTTERPALPASSVDMAGLSVVTSTPVGVNDHEGRGAVYEATSLAAGRLVHVHPIDGNRFLGLFPVAWTGAVYDQSTPGVVTSKTVSPAPVARWIDARGGGSSAATLPIVGSLVAATSWGAMLYTLGVHQGTPVLSAFKVLDFDVAGGVESVGNTWLPSSVSRTGTEVVWDRGVFQSGQYLYIFGARALDGAVYVQKRKLSAFTAKPLFLGMIGWTPDPLELSPVRDRFGLPMVSSGPVSVTRYQNQWFLAVASRPSTDTLVSFHRSWHLRAAFERLSPTVNLGAMPSATTVYFQSLHPNPEHAAMADPESTTALPYVYTVESATALRTSWGLLPVPRQQP